MKKVLLSVSCFAAMTLSFGQDCSNLFISEYVEGLGNNKAIEIYNPTNQPINLGEYFLGRFNNGNAFMTPYGQNNANTIQLPNDILQPYKTYVVVLDRHAGNATQNDPKVWDELYNMADARLCSSYVQSNAMNFNGNDVVILVKGNATTPATPTNIPMDIIGKIGEDPGGNGTGGWSTVYPHNYSQFLNNGNTADVAVTKDHSLIKKQGVKKGFITPNPTVFNPLQDYDSIPPVLPKRDSLGNIIYQADGVTPQWVGNWSTLGWHKCECDPNYETVNLATVVDFDKVQLFPNPSKGEFTIKGLENITKVEIFNALGQNIESIYNNTQSIVTFDFTDKTGVYMVKLTDNIGRTATQKVIIK